jgi:hypothetical protein
MVNFFARNAVWDFAELPDCACSLAKAPCQPSELEDQFRRYMVPLRRRGLGKSFDGVGVVSGYARSLAHAAKRFRSSGSDAEELVFFLQKPGQGVFTWIDLGGGPQRSYTSWRHPSRDTCQPGIVRSPVKVLDDSAEGLKTDARLANI